MKFNDDQRIKHIQTIIIIVSVTAIAAVGCALLIEATNQIAQESFENQTIQRSSSTSSPYNTETSPSSSTFETQ